MDTIRWGMIGCGDVTEVKSGPAFNKVPGSKLVAVMRRDAAKAADYAARHGVRVWYSDAAELISDPNVNAVYIATPPSSHKELSLLALAAGKPVYVEKPMCLDAAEAREMAAAATSTKLSVAHYRREQPKFKKVLELLQSGTIGDVRMVQLDFFRRQLTEDELAVPKTSWRIDKAIAGGGLFHDIAPHQLDLLLHYFGEADIVKGIAGNQSAISDAADIVTGSIQFKTGVVFSGTWCFSVAPEAEKDLLVITGNKGTISFSVFGENSIALLNEEGKQEFSFDVLEHVQQPMIAAVTDYFLGKRNNPSSAEEGIIVMEWMDEMTK